MKIEIREKILELLVQHERISPKNLTEMLNISAPALFKHLAILLHEGRILKQGRAPKVFYVLAPKVDTHAEYSFTPPILKILREGFAKVTPEGTLQTGEQAFITWCLHRKLDPMQAANEYSMIMEKYHAYVHHGVVQATKKMQNTFPDSALDALYYGDFYSIERFGKTKLGELVLYAKQSQQKALIRMITEEVRPRILTLIEREHIDAICYIPPTIQRNIQFMKELERNLSIVLPKIKITKIKTEIIVPQKTLTKLEDRLENARQSLVVEDEGIYKNILLIDDAVGSGATLYEVARQIQRKKLCTGRVIGFGIVGSMNGFEIIREA